MKNLPKKILVFTKYDNLGASSRLRFLQYIDAFELKNVEFTVAPLFSNKYVKAIYNNKRTFVEVFKGYLKRFYYLIKVNKYDLIWLEKELFPYFPPFFEKMLKVLKIQVVVDYDDAIFHTYDEHKLWIIRFLFKKKIHMVINYSTITISGSDYLFEYAQKCNANKNFYIPTVIDLNRYQSKDKQKVSTINIGWIGSPSTEKFLLPYIDLFYRLHKKHKVVFSFIGINGYEEDFINCVEWHEETEVSEIKKFDIGIMPLTKDNFSKGKCAYKIIQYMALGIPVVASNVGANKTVVQNEVEGFLVETNQDWEACLERLILNNDLRIEMGENGSETVQTQYSLQVQAPVVAKILEIL